MISFIRLTICEGDIETLKNWFNFLNYGMKDIKLCKSSNLFIQDFVRAAAVLAFAGQRPAWRSDVCFIRRFFHWSHLQGQWSLLTLHYQDTASLELQSPRIETDPNSGLRCCTLRQPILRFHVSSGLVKPFSAVHSQYLSLSRGLSLEVLGPFLQIFVAFECLEADTEIE